MKQRIRIEEGEGALEVCLTEPLTPELDAAFRALIRAVQVDARQTGRSVQIGSVQQERVVAVRRRAGLPVLPSRASDD